MARTKQDSVPKQERLPGTTNAIPELDDIGHEFHKIRKQRMKLTTLEVELEGRASKALHKHGLNSYKYQDLTMWIEPGKEKVKVRVDKSGKDEPDPEGND